jgi:hypothetical protein
MEEEERAFRRMPLADEKPAPPAPPIVEEQSPKPVQLPDNDDVRQILDAVVENILTDRELKHTRDFYGTPGANTFALDNNAHRYLWPKKFKPSVPGFTMQREEHEECRGFQPRLRLLGVRS